MAEARPAMMRRLYEGERCSIAEMSAYFGCTQADMRTRKPNRRPAAARPAVLADAARSLMAEGCNDEEVAAFMARSPDLDRMSTPEEHTGDTPK